MTTSYFLPAHKMQLVNSAEGVLLMRLDGQQVALSPPRRALPLSEPDRFITLSDIYGNELGIIRDVAELEPSSRSILQEALSRTYAIRRITRVLCVEKQPLTGQTCWRVEIELDDSGLSLDDLSQEPSTFESSTAIGELSRPPIPVKILNRMKSLPGLPKANDAETVSRIVTEEHEFLINGQEDVQTGRYPHIYIVDTEGNRYEIVNCEALDLDSRRAAEQFF